MQRTLLKSKIHRATVTEADLDYEGSVTIDEALLEAADILPFEQVDVLDITNGSRLTTYAIPGERDSGVMCLNGAAARLVQPGDLVIVCAYAAYDEAELAQGGGHRPRLVFVDEHNRIKKVERPKG